MSEGQNLGLTRQPALSATTLLHLSRATSTAQACLAPGWGRAAGWEIEQRVVGSCGTRPHPCAPVHADQVVPPTQTCTRTCTFGMCLRQPVCTLCVDTKYPPHTCIHICILTPYTRVHPIHVHSPHMCSHLDTRICECAYHNSCGWSVPPYFAKQESILPFFDLQAKYHP